MCANYVTVTMKERLATWFAVPPAPPAAAEVWPGGMAPFMRRLSSSTGYARDAALGCFGLLPHWAADASFGRRTYNARSETVAEKPSFRDAWRLGRRCIVPAEAIYEPCWESGRAVRWRIARADGLPMGIAGLWSAWPGPKGQAPRAEPVLSFTMLTTDATGHALMQRFHRPEDEKRRVVILDEAEYDAWLEAPLDRLAEIMRRPVAPELIGEPAPLPPRGRKGA